MMQRSGSFVRLGESIRRSSARIVGKLTGRQEVTSLNTDCEDVSMKRTRSMCSLSNHNERRSVLDHIARTSSSERLAARAPDTN